MELLDLYDINGNKLNKTIERGNKNLLNGEYIKLSTVWIKAEDKFLIQKCSEQKGGEYAVTGGHVPNGVTPLDQAVIEANEELGISIKKSALKYLGCITLKHAMFEVYLYCNNNLIDNKFTLQQEEVESVHWLNKTEIDMLISNNLFRKSSAEQFNKYIKNL